MGFPGVGCFTPISGLSHNHGSVENWAPKWKGSKLILEILPLNHDYGRKGKWCKWNYNLPYLTLGFGARLRTRKFPYLGLLWSFERFQVHLQYHNTNRWMTQIHFKPPQGVVQNHPKSDIASLPSTCWEGWYKVIFFWILHKANYM